MTLEEAIKHAEATAKAKEREAKENRNHGGWAYDDEATKCSACAAEHRQLAEWLRDYKRLKEQKPCEDAISRQAVLDLVNADWKYENLESDIANLPPVTPQPKIGRWIVNEWGNISCSECGCTALYDKVYPGESVFGKAVRVKSTFCPTCGAKMEVEK